MTENFEDPKRELPEEVRKIDADDIYMNRHELLRNALRESGKQVDLSLVDKHLGGSEVLDVRDRIKTIPSSKWFFVGGLQFDLQNSILDDAGEYGTELQGEMNEAEMELVRRKFTNRGDSVNIEEAMFGVAAVMHSIQATRLAGLWLKHVAGKDPVAIAKQALTRRLAFNYLERGRKIPDQLRFLMSKDDIVHVEARINEQPLWREAVMDDVDDAATKDNDERDRELAATGTHERFVKTQRKKREQDLGILWEQTDSLAGELRDQSLTRVDAFLAGKNDPRVLIDELFKDSDGKSILAKD